MWLEREGFIAPKPGGHIGGDEYFITRRGEQIKRRDDFKAYQKSSLLPKKQIHSRIAQKVWATFLRGDYDTAVFQAFKEVEVAVREGCNLSDSDIGVPLMRKAFNPETGILTDTESEGGERVALMELFEGAIGSYKNPHSHRNIQIEAEEAVEMITLASHLLKIVDDRVKNLKA